MTNLDALIGKQVTSEDGSGTIVGYTDQRDSGSRHIDFRVFVLLESSKIVLVDVIYSKLRVTGGAL